MNGHCAMQNCHCSKTGARNPESCWQREVASSCAEDAVGRAVRFQSQKMEALGRLASGVAHDFNNLLTIILNSAEFALEELDEDSQAGLDVAEVAKAARRACELSGQLLAFSREHKDEALDLNLGGVLEGICSMLRRLIPETIELDVGVESSLWSIRGEKNKLEQVIVNLVLNGRDAIRGNGRIRLRVENRVVMNDMEPESRWVVMSVSDTGVGMSDEQKHRLFDPFYTTKIPGEGTGLGLAIVHEVIKEHEGRIVVDSTKDKGTVFTVFFPAV